jgi:hypothetical protein
MNHYAALARDSAIVVADAGAIASCAGLVSPGPPVLPAAAFAGPLPLDDFDAPDGSQFQP